MSYALGVDLGTTYTAAAIVRAGGQVETFPLGDHEAAVPTVVRWPRDAEVLVGEPAERRAATSPEGVAREFKRRLGDPTPLLLDGVPRSPQLLMATVLQWVVRRVLEREGASPAAVGVTYPANWGGYRRELLDQAIRQVGVAGAVLVPEPQAAALRYASTERVPEGATVGVYDWGGGTFDAAVVRRTASGFELLGQPAGIEHLGGVDVDQAVLGHVQRAVGAEAFDVDPDDLAVAAAVHQLRRDCVMAKESLSYDTETLIPVNLPTVHTVVRLTRTELEELVRPLVLDTVEAFRRACASAGVDPGSLTSVLLAGGASRMPLVAQTLGAALGRPVALDAHPKHVVALGAALWAASGGSLPAPAPEVSGTAAAGGSGTVAAGSAGSTVPAGLPREARPVGRASPGPIRPRPPSDPSAAPNPERSADPVPDPSGPAGGGAPTRIPGTTAGRRAAPGRPGAGTAGTAGTAGAAGAAGSGRDGGRTPFVPDPVDHGPPAGMAGLGARVRALPGHPDVVLMAGTATCLLLLVLVSVVGLGGGPQARVAVQNRGGSPASVSLGEPVVLSPARPQPTVTIRVAGIPLPPSGDPEDATARRQGAVSLSASQYLVAGDAEATVTGPGYSERTVIHADGGLLTVPGIGGIALLLFALAYAESLLRPVRRRRRSRGSTLAGMAVVGVVLGLGVAFVGWALVGNHVLDVRLLLVAALLGNATALGLTVLLARRDPAARS